PSRAPRALHSFPTRRSSDLSVSLDDVAVDGDLPRAQGAGVDRGAQRPSDEALNLLTTTAGVASRSGVRGTRQHGVLGGHPALALDRKSTRLNSSHLVISYAV